MPSVPISVDFSTTNTQSIRQVETIVNRLNKSIRQLLQEAKKATAEAKRLKKSFDMATKSAQSHNKAMLNVKKRLQVVRKEARMTNNQLKKYTSSTKGASKATTGMSRSLGVSGLVYGFVGSAAGQAATQIRDYFTEMVDESAELITELTRTVAFSDIGVVDGKFNTDALTEYKNEILRLANVTGHATLEVAKSFREVEKAVGPDIDARAYTKAVLDMKQLEKDLSGEQIAVDMVTISENFPTAELEELTDSMFAASAASKLSFSGISKTMGFASQSVQKLGGDMVDAFKLVTQVSNKIAGFQGNAGRNLRQFLQSISDVESIETLKSFGVDIVDEQGNYKEFFSILEGITDKYREMKAVSDVAGADFVDNLKLSVEGENVLEILTALTEEQKKQLNDAFENAIGTFEVRVGAIEASPEKEIQKIKNTITEVKLAFVTGLAPTISELNKGLNEIMADGEVNKLLVEFGTIVGKDLTWLLKQLLKVVKQFTKVLKRNKQVLRPLSAVIVGLVTALSGLSIIAPAIGLVIALTWASTALTGAAGTAGATAAIAGLTKSFLRFIIAAGGVVVMLAVIVRLMKKIDSIGTSQHKMDWLDVLLPVLSGAGLGFAFGGPAGAAVGGAAGGVLAGIQGVMGIINLIDQEVNTYDNWLKDFQSKPIADWDNFFRAIGIPDEAGWARWDADVRALRAAFDIGWADLTNWLNGIEIDFGELTTVEEALNKTFGDWEWPTIPEFDVTSFEIDWEQLRTDINTGWTQTFGEWQWPELPPWEPPKIDFSGATSWFEQLQTDITTGWDEHFGEWEWPELPQFELPTLDVSGINTWFDEVGQSITVGWEDVFGEWEWPELPKFDVDQAWNIGVDLATKIIDGIIAGFGQLGDRIWSGLTGAIPGLDTIFGGAEMELKNPLENFDISTAFDGAMKQFEEMLSGEAVIQAAYAEEMAGSTAATIMENAWSDVDLDMSIKDAFLEVLGTLQLAEAMTASWHGAVGNIEASLMDKFQTGDLDLVGFFNTIGEELSATADSITSQVMVEMEGPTRIVDAYNNLAVALEQPVEVIDDTTAVLEHLRDSTSTFVSAHNSFLTMAATISDWKLNESDVLNTFMGSVNVAAGHTDVFGDTLSTRTRDLNDSLLRFTERFEEVPIVSLGSLTNNIDLQEAMNKLAASLNTEVDIGVALQDAENQIRLSTGNFARTLNASHEGENSIQMALGDLYLAIREPIPVTNAITAGMETVRQHVDNITDELGTFTFAGATIADAAIANVDSLTGIGTALNEASTSINSFGNMLDEMGVELHNSLDAFNNNLQADLAVSSFNIQANLPNDQLIESVASLIGSITTEIEVTDTYTATLESGRLELQKLFDANHGFVWALTTGASLLTDNNPIIIATGEAYQNLIDKLNTAAVSFNNPLDETGVKLSTEQPDLNFIPLNNAIEELTADLQMVAEDTTTFQTIDLESLATEIKAISDSQPSVKFQNLDDALTQLTLDLNAVSNSINTDGFISSESILAQLGDGFSDDLLATEIANNAVAYQDIFEKLNILSQYYQHLHSAIQINDDQTNQLTTELQKLKPEYQKNIESVKKVITNSDNLSSFIPIVRNSFGSLNSAIKNLTAKINRTKVVFHKNEEGQTTGFSLKGGISKGDASYYANSFAMGGVVKKPTLGIVGDVAGGEAILPLKDIPSLVSAMMPSGEKNITINLTPTISIENNGGDVSASDIADEVMEKIETDLISKVREVIE